MNNYEQHLVITVTEYERRMLSNGKSGKVVKNQSGVFKLMLFLWQS